MKKSTQKSESGLVSGTLNPAELAEQLLAIIENALDAVITINAAGVITGWNHQAEQIFGWSRHEAQGLRLSETIVPHQYREAHERGMQHYLATGEGPALNKRIEITARHRTGREFPVELTISPIQTDDTVMFSAFVRDITARKQVAEALQESEARTRAILDTAAEGIITIDEHGIIETLNPAAARIFGYSLDEVIGRNVSMLMPEPYRSRHDGYLANYLATGQGKIIDIGREIEGRRKNGDIFPIYLAVSEVELDDRRLFTGIVRDITDLKQAEESLQKLNEELEQRITERTAELHQINAELRNEITERQRLEQRYRTLFEEAPAMYVISENVEQVPFITDCNQLFAHTLGYSRQEIVGRPMADFYADASREEMLSGGYERALKGQFIAEERQLVGKAGQIIDTLLSAVPELDSAGHVVGTRAMFVDITERKQLETENDRLYQATLRLYEASQQQVKELTALNTISQAATATLELDQLLTQITDHIFKLLEIEAASLVLKDPSADELLFVTASGARADVVKGQRTDADQGIVGWCIEHGESVLVPDTTADPRFYNHADQLKSHVSRSVLCVPLQSKGQTMGAIELTNKTSDPFSQQDLHLLNSLAAPVATAIENAQLYKQIRHHATELEQRVAERTAELRAANAELARAARMKDEFLASMSHELRTPLNAILGMSEALQEQTFGPLNAEQLEALHDVAESGRHLLSLINDILDLSKIEAGKLELQIEPVSVEDVSQACLRLVKQPAHQKKLKVLFTLDETITTIRADERYLKQILVNLLSNAVKFTPEGGKIGLEITGDMAQKFVRFTVWDTGIGIPAEDMGRLFQPFVQLDSRLDRTYGGTGLGLALVYRMTELHGGSVAVTSDVGQGSRFVVTLPWAAAAEDDIDAFGDEAPAALLTALAEAGSVTAATPPASLRHPPLILMAEDNESNIKTFSAYLSGVGYRVEVAWNGIEAITQARVLQPDLILMDIQMPEMDGLEAIRHLRADPHLVDIPIIAVTALAMVGDRERCLTAGANEYLSKPVNLKMLVETIETLLATPPTRTTS